MAFSALNNTQTAWFLANRPGGLPSGTPGTCLVSDLLVGDYDVGSRGKVSALGATTSGLRSVTFTRNGLTFTVNWTATSTVLIIR